jgi:hypothetical protein
MSCRKYPTKKEIVWKQTVSQRTQHISSSRRPTHPNERQGHIDEELNQLLAFKVLGSLSAAARRHGTQKEDTNNLAFKQVAGLVE